MFAKGLSLLASVPGQPRAYKFLAYSNSAMREAQFWFVTQEHNVGNLIDPLADFKKETELLKRHARIG